MSVRDADIGDLYVNEAGHVYRVVATCHEPTVHMESVETKQRLSGGVSGCMWHSFQRVWKNPHTLASMQKLRPVAEGNWTNNSDTKEGV